jgi:hypothetical protein
MPILLNDILKFDNLNNIKIRFNQSNKVANPIDVFKEDRNSLLNWQFHNYPQKKSFWANNY